MAKCMNCGATLGCSCQKRVAKDGKSVCASCISSYEKGVVTNSPSGTKREITHEQLETAQEIWKRTVDKFKKG